MFTNGTSKHARSLPKASSMPALPNPKLSVTRRYATFLIRPASYSFLPASMSDISLESIISCPNCAHQKLEVMATDQCVFFYECQSCKIVLRPLAGDCCVFCSYGTSICPLKAAEVSCC